MFTVYTKENCPRCEQAKSLLATRQLQFEVIGLGEGITRDELLAKIPTARTMPQILKDGEAIGGLAELRRLLGEV